MSGIKGKEFTIVIDGEETTLFFKRPTHAELLEIDMTYRKIYASAVRSGLMVEREAKNVFKGSGAWNKENEDSIRSISVQIALLEKTINDDALKDEDRMKAVEKISALRAELFELIGERTNMFSNTAEGLANEQRMHKFAELCCFDKTTNQPYFNDYEAYQKFVSEHATELSEIYKQGYLFEYALPEDITESWSEIKYLKKVAERANKEEKQEIVEQKE